MKNVYICVSKSNYVSPFDGSALINGVVSSVRARLLKRKMRWWRYWHHATSLKPDQKWSGFLF